MRRTGKNEQKNNNNNAHEKKQTSKKCDKHNIIIINDNNINTESSRQFSWDSVVCCVTAIVSVDSEREESKVFRDVINETQMN